MHRRHQLLCILQVHSSTQHDKEKMKKKLSFRLQFESGSSLKNGSRIHHGGFVECSIPVCVALLRPMGGKKSTNQKVHRNSTDQPQANTHSSAGARVLAED